MTTSFLGLVADTVLIAEHVVLAWLILFFYIMWIDKDVDEITSERTKASLAATAVVVLACWYNGNPSLFFLAFVGMCMFLGIYIAMIRFGKH